jgi:AmmeMemoRadiSam system protein A
MNAEQKRVLLAVARRTVEAQVGGRQPPAASSEDPDLNRPCGAFVTLHVGGRLRGCIGNFQGRGPLIETVREMAVAATRDPRFVHQPLRADELEDLDIEISVLSPLEKAANPLDIELGVHGIYITRGGATGCFLPQVATETGWSKEQFLSHCCAHKAGLSPDAWRDPQTTTYTFTAEVFGEKQLGTEGEA